MKFWTPWVAETKALILKSARYIFASLTLSFIILANIAVIIVILNQAKAFLK